MTMSQIEYAQSVIRHQSEEIKNLKMEVRTSKLELETEKLKYERRLGVLAEIASESRRLHYTGPSKDEMLDSLRYSLAQRFPKKAPWWKRWAWKLKKLWILRGAKGET